jgi:DNA-binding IclR family transcriptional regulator
MPLVKKKYYQIASLDKIDSFEILKIDAPLWSKTLAYCTVLGKAISAFPPKDELRNYLAPTRSFPMVMKITKKQKERIIKWPLKNTRVSICKK